MKLYSLFLLTLCFIIFSNIGENFARKNSEAFKRCLKQMKTSLKECLSKLTGKEDKHAKQKEHIHHQPVDHKTDNTTTQHSQQLVKLTPEQLANQTSEEQKSELLESLYNMLMEKLQSVPRSKLKMNLLDRFKKELAKTMKLRSKNESELATASMEELQESLIEKLKTRIQQQEKVEGLQSVKERRKLEGELQREEWKEEMKEVQQMLAEDLKRRSELKFEENAPNRIRVQITNTTSIRETILELMKGLKESRDILDEIKRTCRECKRVYEVEVAATIDLASYLLQNVDMQIDIMTAFIKVMNHQPNLASGTLEFDFQRAVLDESVIKKAPTEIFEMTRSFAEMRKKKYKLDDRMWRFLANSTGVMFIRLHNEILTQSQRLSLTS